jgi:hypothetical protein
MLREVLRDHARKGDPKLTDRLVSLLLARVVQTDALLRRDERRGQVPPQHLFFTRQRTLQFWCLRIGSIFRGRDMLLLYALRRQPMPG